MNDDEPAAQLPVFRCDHCHTRYLPRPGPCPSCGSADTEPTSISPVARVLAATELLYPAAGWTAPHRLVLVEGPDGVRVLARVEGELPAVGRDVVVRPDGAGYVAVAGPAAHEDPGRGEGESPGPGRSRRPFEPPR